jgi:hypothetical protein
LRLCRRRHRCPEHGFVSGLAERGRPDLAGRLSRRRLSSDRSPTTLVLLSFSGGGKRSAAFGYGVLKGLRDYPVTVDGSQKRLLDTVDIMSSVSGGSFPAAYYGLITTRFSPISRRIS